MIRRTALALAATAAASIFVTLGPVVLAEDQFIIVQSTTSTQNSGLFDHILPIFQERTGIQARVVAVGTGQALKNARNCDRRRSVRARQARQGKVRRGRLWHRALRRDVQRLHDCGACGGPCQGGRHDRCGCGAADDRRSEGAVRLARGRFRYTQEKTKPGRRRVSIPQGRAVSGTARLDRAWADPQHRGRYERLCADRPRHVDQLRQQGRFQGAGRGPMRCVVQSVRRYPGEPGALLEPQDGAGQQFVNWITEPRVSRRSPATS